MPLDVFLLASWIGSAAFALSGFLVGARKNLDLMGVFILAFLTANGGGMIRDALVGQTPMALTDMSGFLIVVIAFTLGLILARMKHTAIEKRALFVITDSIGLVAFSLTGALVGLEFGLSVFGVAVLSFITATGGGILRDILANEVPAVFKSDFYGSIAVLVALTIYVLDMYGYHSDLSTFIVFLMALSLRLIAYKMQWHLPRLKF
ncbi:MAG: trimeric intracellular cation channel family protein [Alphaproteobacteria bacterium]|nr:trimeric intracellular cation channel family protein [Alphaproteobacteria bacterium]